MIKIAESSFGKSEFIDYMLFLFRVTSEPVYPSTIQIPTSMFREYIEILYTRSGQQIPEMVVSNNISMINIEDNPSRVVLAFSGGKDSSSHAAFLKDMGMNPDLFFVKNLNKSYPNELSAARDVAKILNCKLVEDSIGYSGKFAYAESPVKNHLILAMMIEYMRQNNLTRCACGTYIEDNLSSTPTQFGLSDAYELYRAFEMGVKSFFPNFKWMCWFNSEYQAMSYLVRTHPEVIPYYQSCILPDRYRPSVKRANEKKFGISIMQNRCLSCWKCAQEYLILSSLGYLDKPSDELYGHLKDVLKRNLAKVLSEERFNEIDYEHESVIDLLGYYINSEDYEKYNSLDHILDYIDMKCFD